ncbi:MAG: DUF1538 domain-containing protein [Magnetococcales bacterium]|nr:DUF1538 domain-containing protein [Magnetococcales bacterium]MBF0437491.1 DUF1538 domain-containing protein [Magnetococcales bacterium]
MNTINLMLDTFLDTIIDIAPIVVLIVFFQLFILKNGLPHPKRLALGIFFVLIGITLFLVGLEKALFPIGKLMATQLSAPEFLFGSKDVPATSDWTAYGWLYLFGALIGFATTMAEPALIAVAFKANQVSRGTIKEFTLRLAVALGVAFGISLGCFRIVTGTSLALYIVVGYIIVMIQTWFAPKFIISLAYDSGGVTTSTVTVPLITALGIGLSSTVPGRNPAIDGFGLIAFASLFPMMTVMGYAQLAAWQAQKKQITSHNS